MRVFRATAELSPYIQGLRVHYFCSERRANKWARRLLARWRFGAVKIESKRRGRWDAFSCPYCGGPKGAPINCRSQWHMDPSPEYCVECGLSTVADAGTKCDECRIGER